MESSVRQILNNRSLLILGLAESVSNLGNWITMMALYALVMFRGEGGVLESSGIMLAGLGPMLVAGPVAGWLTDRYDRKRLLIGAQLLAGLPVLALIFLARGWLLYLLLALQAIFLSVATPARQAAVPQLVSRSELSRANAFLQQLSSFVKIGAPILGGVLVAALGPQLAMGLDLLTFLVAALVLSRLPALPPATEEMVAEGGESATQAKGTALLPALRAAPRLRLLFVALFFAILVIMGFDVLSSLVVRDILEATEQLFGVMIGLVGLGSVLSGLLLMLRRKEVDPWQDMLWGLFLIATLPASIAVAAWLGHPAGARLLVGAGAFVGGLGNGLLVIQTGTLLQLLSPPALLGRMGGLLQSTVATAQLLTIVAMPLLVPAFFSIAFFFGLSALLLALLPVPIIFTIRRSQQGLARPLAGD
jgi:MFS family permease